jgi:large subunit ribosomal protein L19
MNIIDKLNERTIADLEKEITEFAVGDTLKVHVKVKEGTRERIQVFEGVCIARKNGGVNSNFTVRKISYGEGVERVFPLFSPTIDKIERVRRGDVRRAKLYYLRGRRGKSARITEKNDWGKKTDTTTKVASEKKTAATAEGVVATPKPAAEAVEATATSA